MEKEEGWKGRRGKSTEMREEETEVHKIGQENKGEQRRMEDTRTEIIRGKDEAKRERLGD